MLRTYRSGLFIILLLLALMELSKQGTAAQGTAAWTEVQPISLESEQGLYPTLAADTTGVVHAFWSSRPSGQVEARLAIVYARYANGSWSQPVDVLMSPSGQDALFSRAVVDGQGRLHVFWSAPDLGPFGPLYHAWAPMQDAASAQSWTAPAILSQGVYQPDAMLDSEGTLHVVYDAILDNKGICHVASSDAGDTWGEATCIPATYPVRDDEHEIHPRLAIDSQGSLHVVWVLDDYSPESKLGYDSRAVLYSRSTDGGRSWSPVRIVDEVDGRSPTYDPQTLQPAWGNVVVDREDRVHIVWVGTPDMQRYHEWSSNGGITWSPRQVAIPSGGYNQWQGIAVDSAGTLHLVWPSLRGIEHASWTRTDGWSVPVQLAGKVGGPHYAAAVVALGNQLHVVFQNGSSDTSGARLVLILHAILHTGTPAVTPRPVPAASPPARPEPTLPTAIPTDIPATPTPGFTRGAMPESGTTLDASSFPVLVGVLPVLALIVGTVLLLARRRR